MLRNRTINGTLDSVFKYMHNVDAYRKDKSRFCGLCLADNITDLGIAKLVSLPNFRNNSEEFVDSLKPFIGYYNRIWRNMLPSLDVDSRQRIKNIKEIIDKNPGIMFGTLFPHKKSALSSADTVAPVAPVASTTGNELFRNHFSIVFISNTFATSITRYRK